MRPAATYQHWCCWPCEVSRLNGASWGDEEGCVRMPGMDNLSHQQVGTKLFAFTQHSTGGWGRITHVRHL